MAFSTGCGGCLGVRLALEDLASNTGGPFPEVATDALLKRIFNLSIFCHHGPDAIVTARLPACAGAWSIYNSPATNITAAKTIASIAVISSSISFTGRTVLGCPQKNAATHIRFRYARLRSIPPNQTAKAVAGSTLLGPHCGHQTDIGEPHVWPQDLARSVTHGGLPCRC
jgi:hypothetical protein